MAWRHAGNKPLPESMMTQYAEAYMPDQSTTYKVNTLRPRQNGRHFPDDIFKRIFLNENV